MLAQQMQDLGVRGRVSVMMELSVGFTYMLQVEALDLSDKTLNLTVLVGFGEFCGSSDNQGVGATTGNNCYK